MKYRSWACASVAMVAACAAPAFAQNTAAPSVSEVNVTARLLANEYYTPTATDGTKSDLPNIETPLSVRVLGQQLLQDIGATRLDDALLYMGGVNKKNNFGGTWDNYSIRGLGGTRDTGDDYLLNGVSGNRGFSAPRDLANIAAVEVIKGPAASLYGSSEVTGLINVITKKPSFTAARSVEADIGSYSDYRGALDLTGPLSNTLAYALNASVEDRSSFRDTPTKRWLVAPALTWSPSGDTSITYSGEIVHFRSRLDRGVILVKNQLDDRLYKTYLGEPGADHTTIDNQTHQVLLSHTLSADWKLRGQLSYRHSEYDDASTQGGSLQSDNVTYRRVRRLRRFVSDDYVGQADVLGKVEWGGLKQEVLFGVEAYAFTLDYRLAGSTATAGAPFAINIFNPVYGQPLPTVLPTTAYMFNRDHNIAGYAQDILSIGKFRILGSVRVDGYHQDFDNRLVGRRTVQDRTATSPRIGVSYLASPEWTLYANAGNSFRPNDGGDRSGAPFSPETGNSYEAGVKYQSPNGRIGGSIAAFSIRKQNILATDPVNTSFQIALGEVKSEGFDFDLAGQVTEHLRLTASGAYLDTRVSKDSTLPVGALVTNVPHWSSSALAVWEGTAGSSGARFGVGAGPSYVGKRAGNATNSFTLPAFATVRALAYVNYQRWRVSLDADNLFDTHYYDSSLSNTSIFPGTLRQVTLRVSASF